MLSWRRPSTSGSEPDLRRIAPMLQTEDAFTSLTHAASAILTIFGCRRSSDEVAAITGDCFALQWDVQRPRFGWAAADPLLEEAFRDTGVHVRFVADQSSDEHLMRITTVIRAGINNFRPSLVLGGWQPVRREERDWFWGLVHADQEDGKAFLGSTMRDLLLYDLPAGSLVWPHRTGSSSAVYIVEGFEPPRFMPGRLARRALMRGVRILAGEAGAPGPAVYDELLAQLRSANGHTQAGLTQELPLYPFPARLAVRCQFEAQARFLRGMGKHVPRRRRASHRIALQQATRAAELLLEHEPPRLHPRAARGPVQAGRPPWGPDAWPALARAIAEKHTPAYSRELELLEQLRQLHTSLIEALDMLVAD